MTGRTDGPSGAGNQELQSLQQRLAALGFTTQRMPPSASAGPREIVLQNGRPVAVVYLHPTSLTPHSIVPYNEAGTDQERQALWQQNAPIVAQIVGSGAVPGFQQNPHLAGTFVSGDVLQMLQRHASAGSGFSEFASDAAEYFGDNPLAIINPAVYLQGASTGAAAATVTGNDASEWATTGGNAAVIGGAALTAGTLGLDAAGAFDETADVIDTADDVTDAIDTVGDVTDTVGGVEEFLGGPWGTVLQGILGIGAGVISAEAAERAAEIQAQAAREGIGAAATMTAPWRNVGALSLYNIASMLGMDPREAFPGGLDFSGTPGSDLVPAMPAPGEPGSEFGSFTRPFTMDDLTIDPGYQFRRDEGTRGIENLGAARGMQLSGATLKNLGRFNQDLASTEFQNAWNRARTGRIDQYNALANLAGLGQVSAGQTAAQVQSGMSDIGNAQAGGVMGRYGSYANTAAGMADWLHQIGLGGR